MTASDNLIDIEVADHRFKLEVHPESEVLSNLIRHDPIYSLNDLRVMETLVKPGAIVCDIGANIGWHSMYLSKLVGPQGQVIAFEPDPKNLKLLESNRAHNSAENVQIVSLALSDSVRKDTLFKSDTNFGDHVLGMKTTSPDLYPETVEVQCTTFDAFLKTSPLSQHKISFLKVDAQGSEPLIFSGMAGFLNLFRPKIIMEYSPGHIRAVGRSVFDVFSFIERYSYLPYLIQKDRNLPLNRILRPLTIFDLIEATQSLDQEGYGAGCDLLLQAD
jgi:FkbM family methyltransferase